MKVAGFDIGGANTDLAVIDFDGDEIKKDDTLAKISGNANVILKGERTALNYIQRMSGIATETNKYVNALKDFKANKGTEFLKE